jgi:arginine decarboxylase
MLMASLDSTQAQMASEGCYLVQRTFDLAEELVNNIKKIPGYDVFSEGNLPAGYFHDPTKILVSAAGFGLTGWELADILFKKYGIVVEMSDYYYVLFLLTIGHNKEDVTKVFKALRDIWQFERKDTVIKINDQGLLKVLYEKPVFLTFSPREVFYKKKEEVNINCIEGRICGKPLTVYPPGIPCIWPGQLIEKEHVEYLKWAMQNELSIQGMNESGNIEVIN